MEPWCRYSAATPWWLWERLPGGLLPSRVGQTGRVYANDIVETKALEVIRARAKDKGLANIETILGSEEDQRFPKASLEMVFCLNAFHEIRKPVEFLGNLVVSLKPGGKGRHP